jgi:hypothetical protein
MISSLRERGRRNGIEHTHAAPRRKHVYGVIRCAVPRAARARTARGTARCRKISTDSENEYESVRLGAAPTPRARAAASSAAAARLSPPSAGAKGRTSGEPTSAPSAPRDACADTTVVVDSAPRPRAAATPHALT